jgi:hypothetical protein
MEILWVLFAAELSVDEELAESALGPAYITHQRQFHDEMPSVRAIALMLRRIDARWLMSRWEST